MNPSYGIFTVSDYVDGLSDNLFPGQSDMYWPAWLLPDGTIQAVVNHSDYRSSTDVHTGAHGAAVDGCVRLTLGRDTKAAIGNLGVEFRNTLTDSQRRSVLNVTRQMGYDEVIAEAYGDYGTFLDRGTFAGVRGLNNFLLQFEDVAIAA